SVSLLSSITCRTTMSQRSSGSQGTPVTEDERLLAQVPRERRPFVKSDSWRVLRIMGEVVEGFDTLSDVYNAVTVFGSARTKPEDPYYERAVETPRMLAEEGFPIITGGGPGVMEAASGGGGQDRHHRSPPLHRHRQPTRGRRDGTAGTGAAQHRPSRRDSTRRGGAMTTRKDFLRGQRIDPKPITGRETVPELVDNAFLAYNAGRLSEACRLFS